MPKKTAFLLSKNFYAGIRFSRRRIINYILVGKFSGLPFFLGADLSKRTKSNQQQIQRHTPTLGPHSPVFDERNRNNAIIAAALPHGSKVMLGDLAYKTDYRALGTASVLNDLGVDRLVPLGEAMAGHFGIETSGDQASKITAAFQWSIETGKTIRFPKGTYRVDTRLSVEGSIRIEGDGDETIFDFSRYSSRQTLIEITQLEVNPTTVSSALPLTVGTSVVTLADASGYSVGDMVLLRSTEDFSTTKRGISDGNKRGELAIIAHKSANRIGLTQGIRDKYSNGTITATMVTPNLRPTLKNFRIKGAGSEARQWGLRINYAVNPEVSGISFEDVEDIGLSLSYCDGGYVHNCIGNDIAGTVSKTGYAFAADLMTRDAVFENLRADSSSCLFSTGGLYAVWDNLVTNCVAYDAASERPAIQTHINGVRTVVEKSSVTRATVGIGMFGPHSTIRNNTTIECSNSGIYTSDEGSVGIVVSGNTVKRCLTGINIGMNSGSRSKSGLLGPNYVYEGIGKSSGISCSADDMTIDSPRVTGHSPGILVQGDRVVLNNVHIIGSGPYGNHIGIYWWGDDGKVIGGAIDGRSGEAIHYGVAAVGRNLMIDGIEINGISETNAISRSISASVVLRNVKVDGKHLDLATE